MVAIGLCVMYYDRSCAWTGNRPDVARKQNRNYRSVVRTVPGNYFMTYTVATCISTNLAAFYVLHMIHSPNHVSQSVQKKCFNFVGE